MRVILTAGAICLLLLTGKGAAQTTVEIVATRDTTIFQDRENNSNGAGDSMVAGRTSSGNLRRALVAFDDLTAIPPGASIISAELRMELVNTQVADTAVTLHQLEASWGQAGSVPVGGPGQGGAALAGDATWIHRDFDSVLWNAPGGDFDRSPLATTTVTDLGPYAWTSAALAGLVQDWASGNADKHGLMIVGDETIRSAKHYSTSEGTTPPTLVVTFSTDGTTGPFAINQGLAGAWFEPETAGQGFLIDIEPETSFIFIAWFTYEAAAAKVGSADQRWLTAQGVYQGDDAMFAADNAVVLPVFNTTGGNFDQSGSIEQSVVGFVEVRFDSCTEAELRYDLDEGLASTIALQRVIPGTEALCEALIEAR